MPVPANPTDRIVLQTIFDALLQSGAWLTFRVLDKRLHRRGVQFGEIDKSGFRDLIFSSRLDMPMSPDEQLKLTFAGVAACEKSGPVIDLFLRIVQFAVRVEDQAPESSTNDPILTEKMVRAEFAPTIPHDAYRAVVPLLILEPWGHMGSAVGENGWAFTLSSRLRRFAGRTSPEDYWDQRQLIFAPTVQFKGEGTLSVAGQPSSMTSVSSLGGSSGLSEDDIPMAGHAQLTAGSIGGMDEEVSIHEAVSTRLARGKPASSIPAVSTITSDSLSGPDLLGVTEDAQALAALIASRQLSPPFAIAVYGPWGNGKSFFMEQIHIHVDRFAKSEASLFHHRIRQVRFSAWHYAETNLWASLLYHIFHELDRSSDGTDDFLRVVMEDVESAQVVVHTVKAQLDAASASVGHTQDRLRIAENTYAETQAQLERLNGQDLWEALKDFKLDEVQKATVSSALDELGVDRGDGSVKELRANIGSLISLASDSRRLSTVGGWRSPLVLGSGAGLVISAAVVAFALAARPDSSLSSIVASGIGELVAGGSAVAVWSARCGALLKRIMTPAQALQTRIDQRLDEARVEHGVQRAKLEAELDHAEHDRITLRDELTQAQHNLARAKTELDSLTGARLLEQFLTERASSSDYRQYLGLIGLAHRDLLSLGKRMERALTDAESAGTVIDRIVLYIDDLDRCSPETVSHVLDAVHLLLALPLFAVVVGVDPQWLAQSLTTQRPALRHADLNAYAITAGPNEFLEKIFHLTYTLPDLTAEGVVNLVTAQLLPATEEAQQDADLNASGSAMSDEEGDGSEPVLASRTTEATPTPEYQDAAEIAVAVTLTEDDIAALRDVAPMLARSPRKVMRFYNILAVVRASINAAPELVERIQTGSGSQELLLAVALMTSLPSVLRLLLLEPAGDSTTLKSWLTSLKPEHQHVLGQEGLLLAEPSGCFETTVANLQLWLPHVVPWVSV
jgi:hypothetical protein